MQSLWLIFQLLCCLCLGLVLAKRLPRIIEKIAFQLLPYFSYILLIAIAMEFSQTLGSLQQPSHILSTALQIAFATSIGAFLCCYLLYKGLGLQATQGKVSLQLLIQSCINISYAFFALLAGYVLHLLFSAMDFQVQINTWYLLLLFMWMIGLDLAYSPLDRSWLNWKILMVPVGCISGSIAGVLLCALWLPIALQDLLMLSQGYGFYSMSGIVVSELRNAELGSIALMNDLFREIFAILLMYILGWRYPRAAISAAGATAMDVTLPMVKQACGNDFIPHAMVSGFVLSILAPIAVSVLAAI